MMAEPQEESSDIERLVQALRERVQLQQIVDLVPMIVFAKDWAGRFLLANKAMANAYGVTVEDILTNWRDPGPRDEVSRKLDEDRAVMRSGRPLEIPRRTFVDARGNERLLHITKVPFVTANSDNGTGTSRLAMVGVAVDVTERLRAEEQFQLAIEAAPAGMLMTDRTGAIVLVNHEIERMFGYGRAELIGRPSTVLVPARLHSRHLKLRELFLSGRRPREAVRGREMFGLRKNGTEFPVELAMNSVQARQGQLILSSVTDITERRRHEEEIQKLGREMEQRVIERTQALAAANAQLHAEIAERRRAELELIETKRSLERANDLLAQEALHDPRTGLPNRRAFDAHMLAEVRRAARQKHYLAVLMVDVDHFKEFNDTYGHVAGDECLAKVGAAIGRCMRRPADFAARYGGEEFGAVLVETDHPGAKVVAETLRAEVAQTVQCPAGQPVTVSVGVAVLTVDSDTLPEDLIDAADRALYRAKESGRNRVVVSSERSA